MKKYIHTILLISIDLLVLFIIYFSTIYFINLQNYHIQITSLNFIFILILLMFFEGIYKYRYDFWQESLKIIKSFTIGFFIVITILSFSHNNAQFSKTFVILYFFCAIVLLPVSKRIIKKFIYKFDYFKKAIYIDGSKEEIQKFKNEFEQNWYLGEYYTTKEYDCVLITSKDIPINKLKNLIQHYLQTCNEVYVVPYIQDINFSHSNIMEYSNIRYNTIEVENKLLNKRNIFIKNLSDKFLAIFISPIFLGLHIIISIAIKIDSKGDILFKQKRVGKDGKTFICYKYRTMHQSSEHILENYLKKHPEEKSYYEKYHKYKNDPRITKVGKILRSSSLDELPQIINVLKSDMSIVGPRPYMINELEKLKDLKEFIYKVKPGITGLWQVSGRNNLTFQERNELEVWYIQNWSLWADIVILIKTIKVVFLKIGAR